MPGILLEGYGGVEPGFPGQFLLGLGGRHIDGVFQTSVQKLDQSLGNHTRPGGQPEQGHDPFPSDGHAALAEQIRHGSERQRIASGQVEDIGSVIDQRPTKGVHHVLVPAQVQFESAVEARQPGKLQEDFEPAVGPGTNDGTRAKADDDQSGMFSL